MIGRMERERESGEWLILERLASSEQRRVLFLPGLFGGRWSFFNVIDRPSLAAAGISALGATPPGFAGCPAGAHSLRAGDYAAAVLKLAAAERAGAIVGYSYFANVALEVA